MSKRLLIGAAVGAALVAMAAAPRSAEAALVNCPASFTANTTGKVLNGTSTAASACQYVTPPDPSNVASIANINAAGFFGFSDWVSNGQDQLDGAGSDGASGTWSISSPNFASRDYIIVFKDGGDTNLVAFQFNELFSSGTWSTPFTEPPFSFPGQTTQKDVSHLTIAYRATNGGGGPTPVPEPATLALLGAGLLGIGLARRARRRG